MFICGEAHPSIQQRLQDGIPERLHRRLIHYQRREKAAQTIQRSFRPASAPKRRAKPLSRKQLRRHEREMPTYTSITGHHLHQERRGEAIRRPDKQAGAVDAITWHYGIAQARYRSHYGTESAHFQTTEAHVVSKRRPCHVVKLTSRRREFLSIKRPQLLVYWIKSLDLP